MSKFITPDSTDQEPLKDRPKVFLAGTIDNGDSPDWQRRLFDQYKGKYDGKYPLNIYSPRRSNWDPEASEEQVREQIRWELDQLEQCDALFFGILPGSKSPITMWELGHFATSKKVERTVVYCDPGFWRWHNVSEVCQRYDVDLYQDLDEAWERLASATTLVERLKASGKWG